MGSRGTIAPVIGPRLHYEITGFEPMRSWTWKVAGVAATGHRIAGRPGPSGTTRRTEVVFDAPWWAPFYLPVLWLGLRRLARLAEIEESTGRPIEPEG